jgi:hypothetical protein
VTDCQSRLRSEVLLFTTKAFDDLRNRNNVWKRIWLVLLSLIIVLPFFLAAVRAFRRAPEENKPLWLTVCCTFVLLFVLVAVSIAVWQRADQQIAYVPIPILEWGFAGGMVAVIYRLGYEEHSSVSKLLPWVVARPVVGLFMGGAIYFIALVGGLLTQIKIEGNKQLALNAIVFVAAFNDTFAKAMLGRFVLRVRDDEEKTKNKE